MRRIKLKTVLKMTIAKKGQNIHVGTKERRAARRSGK